MMFGTDIFGDTAFVTGDSDFFGNVARFILDRNRLLNPNWITLIKIFPWDPAQSMEIEYRIQDPGRSGLEWRDADEYYKSRVAQAANWQITAIQPGTQDPFSRAVSNVGFGTLQIQLDRSDDDSFVDLNWEGRRVEFYFGLPDYTHADFGRVMTTNIERVRWDETTITFDLSDPANVLDQEIQSNLFDGASTYAGSPNDINFMNPDLDQQPMPIALGFCKNIEPIHLDKKDNVYIVHDGAVNDIVDVWQGGVPYGPAEQSPVGDIDDSPSTVFQADGFTPATTVWEWAPVAGQWITHHLYGIFRIGFHPSESAKITADVKGCAKAGAGTCADQIDEITKAVLIDPTRGIMSASDLDLDTFDRAVLQQPDVMSIYIRDGGVTAAKVLDDFLGPIGFKITFDREGKLQLRQVGFDAPQLTIEPHWIEKIKSVNHIHAIWQRSLGFDKSWTVQDDSDLLGGHVEYEDHSSFVNNEYRRATYVDTDVKTARLRSLDLFSGTSLSSREAAEAEAERQTLFVNSSRDLYEITCTNLLLRVQSLYTIRVKYPRFGFENGKTCLVTGIVENIRNKESKLTIWAAS
jgi:hypothetical protein